MRRFLIALTLLACIGCNETVTIDFGAWDVPASIKSVPRYPAYQGEYPTVNLEEAFREKNWLGPQGEGSCVHASMTMLFRWQGRYDLADMWRRTYADGEWTGGTGLAAKFDKEGVRYAYTTGKKDLSFLEWAVATRRGCGVTMKGGAHMVILIHLDAERAGILDNNFPEEFRWVPRETFLAEWYSSQSWAVTPVYTPPPPLPCSTR
jgi:hypothetical protein